MLAGERGPSYTETSQIKNWKVLHIRLVEPGTALPDSPDRQRDRLAGTVHLFLNSFAYIVNFCAIIRKLDAEILESTSESTRAPCIHGTFDLN